MQLLALDKDFQPVGYLIPLNLQWTREYYTIGQFSIQVAAEGYTPDMAYLYRPDRPETGIIQKVQLTESLKGRFVQLSGYTYTNFAQYMDYEALAKKYTMWLADYRENYNSTLPRDIHQYTSRGAVPGIQGNVDMNNCTRDFPEIIKGAGLNGWTKQPDKPTPPDPKPQPGGTYTVQPGDSWWKIAAEQLGSGSRMQELAAANGRTTADTIHPGQVLTLPSGASQSPAQRTYTVQSGDSWWKIAAEQLGSGSRMYELADTNDMSIEDTIHPGQIIKLP